MNNSILLKEADFSAFNIDSLNLVKLDIAKAGNGYVRTADGTTITVITETSGNDPWPGDNFAYSSDVIVPAGTKCIFGKLPVVMSDTNLEAFITNPESFISSDHYAVPLGVKPILYYDSIAGKWNSMSAITYMENASRPQVVGYREHGFPYINSAVLLNGSLTARRFTNSINVTKLRVSWLRTDGLFAPEIGMAVPELYAWIPN